MSDRSAETTRTAKTTPKPPAAPGPQVETGSDDTAIRPSLADRIQAKLSSTTTDGSPAEAAETAPAKKPGKAAKPPKPGKVESAATPKPAAQAKPAPAAAARGPRRARLRLTRVDPWSVMKTAFLLAIAFGIVTVVSVAMVWTVLDQAGVWTSVNETVKESIGGPETANFDIENYVGTSRVLGFTMLVAAVDVVLLTAIATLGAFLYNMSAALLGGIEVTLAEDAG